MPIQWTLTPAQRKFENELFKPAAWLIGLIFLVGALDIGLLLWTFFHGSFHRWEFPIMIGGFFATQTVMLGGMAYLGIRRRKLSTAQE
jgi:uncharacterized membrane protein